MNGKMIKGRVSNGKPTMSEMMKEAREGSLGARDILIKAEAKAAQILEDARREKEQILADSLKLGYAEVSKQVERCSG